MNTSHLKQQETSDLKLRLGAAESVMLFWIQYKKQLIGLLCCILLGLGAMPLYYWNQQRQTKLYQAQYTQALKGTLAEKLAFVRAAPAKNSLAGLLALELADQAFAEQKYAEAVDYYVEAIKHLSNSVLLPRAILSQAIACSCKMDTIQAQELLQGLITGATVLSSIKAEAMYHSAVLNLATGVTDQAHQTLNNLMELFPNTFWHYKAALLLGKA